MNVTNEQMAEVLGWKRGWDNSCGALLGWRDGKGGFYTELNHWTTDLNLVRELEDMLTSEEREDYLDAIVSLWLENKPEGDNEWAMRHSDAQTLCDAIYPILESRRGR